MKTIPYECMETCVNERVGCKNCSRRFTAFPEDPDNYKKTAIKEKDNANR